MDLLVSEKSRESVELDLEIFRGEGRPNSLLLSSVKKSFMFGNLRKSRLVLILNYKELPIY